ncbi:ABC transporter permease [Chelatococcus composti]|jgi:peptide/nickel transport system permease protein|uniref:Peptide/nickel transport system permease protein n=1 Tax=Chelatococcus composti TaxID=1743235 RepID=A0A841KEH0_9HYPH|nr:ABC transporter permease [Chelatococcus composti]MBB6169354.1 peptide/nickel transport system permease protein [Chelatococcus composti]MBS7736922.1 ABC transporter permease [Chelatococcus composti]PZN44475.1 MAG: peptide ABC transporter permease [Pseudomonadota bacterium]GGG47110.1 peptide ABC transporter permease [Chelatococcus composti]
MSEQAATPAPTAAARPAEKAESLLLRHVAAFFESPLAVVGLAGLVLLVAAALAAPLIAPQDPYDLAQLDIMDGTLPPGAESLAGYTYWLGTDEQGRDMLSAILYGLRISLGVGAVSVVIACAVGASIGVLAAYAGGRIDSLVMRVVDLQLSFPAILVALVLLAVFGRGVDKVIIALVIVQWAYYARTVRGSALVERRRDYIEAARCLALPKSRIVFRHLLPNCLPPLIVVATVQVAHAIALESTLSFLGVGVPVTEPSLGMLIANGYDYLLSGKYWISTFPGIALVAAIVAINLVGDRLRDVLNPRLSR